MVRHHGRIYAHDLDMPLEREPRCIIEFEIGSRVEPAWSIAAYLDQDARPELAFKLCLTLRSNTRRPPDLVNDWPLDEMYIYDLIVKGRGSDAFLEAHKIKSLRSDMGTETGELIFHGNYLVRSVETWDLSCFAYEVCNWLLSDSTVHFKSYINIKDDDHGIAPVSLSLIFFTFLLFVLILRLGGCITPSRWQTCRLLRERNYCL